MQQQPNFCSPLLLLASPVLQKVSINLVNSDGMPAPALSHTVSNDVQFYL